MELPLTRKGKAWAIGIEVREEIKKQRHTEMDNAGH